MHNAKEKSGPSPALLLHERSELVFGSVHSIVSVVGQVKFSVSVTAVTFGFYKAPGSRDGTRL